VRVVALGTGQALDMGRRGDADVVFVHDQVAEEKFVADGWGPQAPAGDVQRLRADRPAADPAGVRGKDITAALQKLAAAGARSSRAATRAAPTPPNCATGRRPTWTWPPPSPAGYKECGCGMGPALNMAASTGAYVLADRGTWLNFKNRADLAILVEGDTRLFNQYGVMVVNPAKHPHVKAGLAQQFADWVVSPAGQGSIAATRSAASSCSSPAPGRERAAAAPGA
jgi:tungstate transport system substrate-binding protein